MDRLKTWQLLAALVLFGALAFWGVREIRSAATPPFRGSCAAYARSSRTATRVELSDCIVYPLDVVQYGGEDGDYYAPLRAPGSDALAPLLLKLGAADIALFKQIADIAGSNRADMERVLLPLAQRMAAPRRAEGHVDASDGSTSDKDFRGAIAQNFAGAGQSDTHLADDWRVLDPDWTADDQRNSGIAACLPFVALALFFGYRLFRDRWRPATARAPDPPGFARIDIGAAARAARHLYVWSSVAIYLVTLGTVAAVAGMTLQGFGGPFTADTLEIALIVPILMASVVVMVRARLRLTWLGYLATGAVLAAALASGASVAAAALADLSSLPAIAPANLFAGAVMSLLAAAAAFALYAWAALALVRYPALGTGPFGVASAVSRLIARTRALAPSPIHAPRNRTMTVVFALLFVLSLPVAVVVGLLIPVIGWFLPVLSAALVRRYYTYDARTLLSLDRRAPVLYLRSFGDDKARTWGKGFFGKLRGRTLDEAIAPFARLLGPYIAIANPGETLPHIGAAQSHFTDETWQDAIAQWVSLSQLIVMQAGRTEGIAWELSHIFGAGRHSRLVVLLPPAMRASPASVTQWLAQHFTATPCAGLVGSVDPARTIALVFHEQGLVAIESAEIRNAEIDYLVAFQHAAFIAFCRQSEAQAVERTPTTAAPATATA